jgi:hypothetical protein
LEKCSLDFPKQRCHGGGTKDFDVAEASPHGYLQNQFPFREDSDMETASSIGIGFGIVAFFLSGLTAHVLFDFSIVQSGALGVLVGVSLGFLATCLCALRLILRAMNLDD